MPAVSSRAISFVDYTPTTSEMSITFTHGRIYVYSDVPLELYNRFLEAHSKGEFYNKFIRDIYTVKNETG